MTDLASALAAPLDRNRIRTRTDGRGGNLAYLETHDVIRHANATFGFGKWGHTVVELRLVGQATVHNKDKKLGISVGYVCIVRVEVDGCVPVSGVGFGDATEYRESGPVTAHELAAKEAESDALKRALKNFGDQFGLALYDKDARNSPHITSVGGDAMAPTDRRSTAEAALIGRLLELAKRWGELKPDTTADEVVGTTNLALAKQRAKGESAAKTVEWLERQVKALEANIASAEADAASQFQKPKDKDKAA